MENLITAAVGLLGTVIGGVISWYANVNRGRTQTAWEMHREWNSEPMNRARSKADKLLVKYPGLRLDKLYDTVPSEESDPLWMVENFHQRLWLAIEHNCIDKKLVPRLFGELFVWFYTVAYETLLLPVDWPSCKDIQALKEWMDDNADPADLKVWTQRAIKDRDGRLTPRPS